MEPKPPSSPQEDPIKRDIRRGLEQIRNLGPHKSMGYLPIDTLSSYFHSNIEAEIKLAEQKGFRHLVFSHTETRIGLHGALFIWQDSALDTLLQENKDILLEAEWPHTTESFVRKVAAEQVLKGTPLYKVIEKAFGD